MRIYIILITLTRANRCRASYFYNIRKFEIACLSTFLTDYEHLTGWCLISLHLPFSSSAMATLQNPSACILPPSVST